MKTHQHKMLRVSVSGIDIDVHSVIFYPYVPATNEHPAEQPMAEWDHVTIGGVVVSELFADRTWGDRLETAIVEALEVVAA